MVQEMQNLTDDRLFFFFRIFRRKDHPKRGLKSIFLWGLLELTINFDFLIENN